MCVLEVLAVICGTAPANWNSGNCLTHQLKLTTGREFRGLKKNNVSNLQEPWRYRLMFCLGIKLFLLMMLSSAFWALYCAVISPRRMSVLVASVSSLLPLLYRPRVAIWVMAGALLALGYLKGRPLCSGVLGMGMGGGAASSPEPLQPPPCPVLSTSNIFRAKISVYMCEAVSFCEIPGSTVVRWSTYPRAAAAVSRMLVSRVGWSSLTWWRELLKSCLWDVEETCELVGKKSWETSRPLRDFQTKCLCQAVLA